MLSFLLPNIKNLFHYFSHPFGLILYNGCMGALLSQCISSKTFKRSGHKVLIRNETSHTQFTKSEVLLIKELKDNGIVLELPVNVCQRGHSLTLFFIDGQSELKHKLPSNGAYKESLFEVVAKVEKLEDIEAQEKTVAATLTFLQYDVREWKQIIEQYEAAQKEINNLIMRQHDLREDNE